MGPRSSSEQGQCVRGLDHTYLAWEVDLDGFDANVLWSRRHCDVFDMKDALDRKKELVYLLEYGRDVGVGQRKAVRKALFISTTPEVSTRPDENDSAGRVTHNSRIIKAVHLQ